VPEKPVRGLEVRSEVISQEDNSSPSRSRSIQMRSALDLKHGLDLLRRKVVK
jgi:hypothetical protein